MISRFNHNSIIYLIKALILFSILTLILIFPKVMFGATPFSQKISLNASIFSSFSSDTSKSSYQLINLNFQDTIEYQMSPDFALEVQPRLRLSYLITSSEGISLLDIANPYSSFYFSNKSHLSISGDSSKSYYNLYLNQLFVKYDFVYGAASFGLQTLSIPSFSLFNIFDYYNSLGSSLSVSSYSKGVSALSLYVYPSYKSELGLIMAPYTSFINSNKTIITGISSYSDYILDLPYSVYLGLWGEDTIVGGKFNYYYDRYTITTALKNIGASSTEENILPDSTTVSIDAQYASLDNSLITMLGYQYDSSGESKSLERLALKRAGLISSKDRHLFALGGSYEIIDEQKLLPFLILSGDGSTQLLIRIERELFQLIDSSAFVSFNSGDIGSEFGDNPNLFGLSFAYSF